MTRPFKGPDSNGGFTLLELLLAFVVFALSFAVVMEILSGSMRNTVRARHYSEAAMTAQSIMDQVGLDIKLEAGTSMDGESGSYRWALDVMPFDMVTEGGSTAELAAVGGVELLEVYLAITWGEPPREQTYEFFTVKSVMMDGGL